MIKSEHATFEQGRLSTRGFIWLESQLIFSRIELSRHRVGPPVLEKTNCLTASQWAFAVGSKCFHPVLGRVELVLDTLLHTFELAHSANARKKEAEWE